MRHRFKIWTLLIVMLLCAGIVYGTTIRDDMTLSGTNTLSGTTTISGTTTLSGTTTISGSTALSSVTSATITNATATGLTVTNALVTNATVTTGTLTNLTVTDATASRVSVSGLLKPSTAGGINIGTLALPFSGAYIGSAGDKNTRVTGTFTGQRTTTVPDADITVSGLSAIDCRKDTTCMSVAIATNGKLVMGSTALASGEAIVTGFSPAFTNTVSYSCSLGVRGTARNQVDWSPTSASSITITSASGADTSVIDYICVGH